METKEAARFFTSQMQWDLHRAPQKERLVCKHPPCTLKRHVDPGSGSSSLH